MFAALEHPSAEPFRRLAFIGPHGYGKRTIGVLGFLLWRACYRPFRTAIIASRSIGSASALLERLQLEILENPRLRRDFPHLTVGEAEATRRRARRHLRQLRLTADCHVVALGRKTGSFHVVANDISRPDLILVVNADDEQDWETPALRRAGINWLEKDILSRQRRECTVVLLGQRGARGSLLGYVSRHADTFTIDAKVYRAIESHALDKKRWWRWRAILLGRKWFEGRSGADGARAFFEHSRGRLLLGAKALWPEHETFYELMEQRTRQGWYRFDLEKQGRLCVGSRVIEFDSNVDTYEWIDDWGMTWSAKIDDHRKSQLRGFDRPRGRITIAGFEEEE